MWELLGQRSAVLTVQNGPLFAQGKEWSAIVRVCIVTEEKHCVCVCVCACVYIVTEEKHYGHSAKGWFVEKRQAI